MPKDTRDILELLRFELQFLEQGGYGRSVRTPWKATSPFQDSPSCLNFNDPVRSNPCSECLLIDFVPAPAKNEDVPCHHIPLNSQGQTVFTMEQRSRQLAVEEALRNWLISTIQRIEQERDTQVNI
jgi:hypothetical protein